MSLVPDTHPLRADLDKMEARTPPVPWLGHASSILDGLTENRIYGLGELARICGRAQVDESVLAAANYLTSSPNSVFDVELHLIDALGRHILAPEQADAVIGNKPISHPVSGELLSDPASSTIICYRLRIDIREDDA